jgi:hypothetical protein
MNSIRFPSPECSPLADPVPLRVPELTMSSRDAWAWCYVQWRDELLGEAVTPERRMLLTAGCSFATQMLALFDRESAK